MEKIKITEEQEEAYKILLKNSNYDAYRVLKDFSTIGDKQRVYNQYKPLLSLTIEELSLILNRWYEVEQPFKVGDWVYIQRWDIYRQIVEIENDCLCYMRDDQLDFDLIGEFEKVTEPWKIMLLELGRDKPEFKEGDKYDTSTPHSITKESHIELATLAATQGYIKYFYPVESRIEVKQ